MIEGEQYGYRVGAKGDFVPVEFIRRGRGRQTRVLIRHLAEEMDSLEEWVPPGRLQVLWGEVAKRRQDEANWAKLTAASPLISEGLKMAIGWTVDTILEPGVMEHSLDKGGGVSLIRDFSSLEQAVGCTSPIPEHSFKSDHGWFVPKDVTLHLAQMLAARNPDRIRRLVERQQVEWQEKEARLHALSMGRPKGRQSIEYEEDTLLCWKYLLEWAGPQ